MWSRETFVKVALDLPRSIKRGIVLLLDIVLCALAVWVTFYLRLGEWISYGNSSWNLDYALAVSALLSIPVFIVSGFYRAIFRYSGWAALKTIVKAFAIYGSIYALIFTFYGVSGIPRTIGLIQPILFLLFVGSSRALASQWLGKSYKKRLNLDPPSRALIYGAGSTGRQLADALVNNHEIRALGFIDDDQSLVGSTINGI
jgi:FlaA1/EpsC-like NDP-sugar epimerase